MRSCGGCCGWYGAALPPLMVLVSSILTYTPAASHIANTSAEDDHFYPPVHYILERELMRNYNNRLIPRRLASHPISIYFSIGLYQIVEVVGETVSPMT